MITIITGTVGLDKVPYLDRVKALAARAGHPLDICHVGQRMYAEAPDVAPGRILDLPLSRLGSLRRSVFKDILTLAGRSENLIVNTHATFRWKHGLFPAFDFDQLSQLNPDMYVCLIDNVDRVHARLLRDHQIDHSLKDLLVWREEETLATELMMLGCENAKRSAHDNTTPPPSSQKPPGLSWGSQPGDSDSTTRKPATFYLLAVGENHATADMLYKLIFQPKTPKAYLSFPMTHVNDNPAILAEIKRFRDAMTQHFIVFDPADVEEYDLYALALKGSQLGQKAMELTVLGETLRFDIPEVMQVAGDIHAQIYARDFKLIDQADMIVSYIPALPDGRPAVSSGVERELQHAHEATREVYVIWAPKAAPSPFITETATRVFKNTDQALKFLLSDRKKPRKSSGVQ